MSTTPAPVVFVPSYRSLLLVQSGIDVGLDPVVVTNNREAALFMRSDTDLRVVELSRQPFSAKRMFFSWLYVMLFQKRVLRRLAAHRVYFTFETHDVQLMLLIRSLQRLGSIVTYFPLEFFPSSAQVQKRVPIQVRLSHWFVLKILRLPATLDLGTKHFFRFDSASLADETVGDSTANNRAVLKAFFALETQKQKPSFDVVFFDQGLLQQRIVDNTQLYDLLTQLKRSRLRLKIKPHPLHSFPSDLFTGDDTLPSWLPGESIIARTRIVISVYSLVLDAAQYYDRGVFISLLDLVDWFDSRMHERWKRHFMDFAPSVHIPATPSELWRLLACSEEPEG